MKTPPNLAESKSNESEEKFERCPLSGKDFCPPNQTCDKCSMNGALVSRTEKFLIAAFITVAIIYMVLVAWPDLI